MLKKYERIFFFVEHVFLSFLFVMLIIRIHRKIMSIGIANVNVQCIWRAFCRWTPTNTLCSVCVSHLTDLNDMEWKQVSLNKLYLLFFSLFLPHTLRICLSILSFLWPYYCLLWWWQSLPFTSHACIKANKYHRATTLSCTWYVKQLSHLRPLVIQKTFISIFLVCTRVCFSESNSIQ